MPTTIHMEHSPRLAVTFTTVTDIMKFRELLKKLCYLSAICVHRQCQGQKLPVLGDARNTNSGRDWQLQWGTLPVPLYSSTDHMASLSTVPRV